MNFQKISWTSTGVPRKNQMYSQLALETSGFGDRRMTAKRIPSEIPITIASTVSSMVISRPKSTGLVVKYWPMTFH